MRDEVLANFHIRYANVPFTLKLAAAGYKALSESIIRDSFITAGLWHMNYRFATEIKTERGRQSGSDTVLCSLSSY